MKRFTLMACAGLMAAAMATPSLAADLPRPAYKAPVFVAPFSWSGFYVGINGGYGWGTSNWSSAAGRQRQAEGWRGRRHARLQPADRQLGLGSGRRHRLCLSRAPISAPAMCWRPSDARPKPLAWHRARPYRLCLRSLAALLHRRRGLRRRTMTPNNGFREQDTARLDRSAAAWNGPSWAPGRPSSNISMSILARRPAVPQFAASPPTRSTSQPTWSVSASTTASDARVPSARHRCGKTALGPASRRPFAFPALVLRRRLELFAVGIDLVGVLHLAQVATVAASSGAMVLPCASASLPKRAAHIVHHRRDLLVLEHVAERRHRAVETLSVNGDPAA